MIGTKVPYTVKVTFENYPPAQNPGAPELEATNNVNYISACANDVTSFSANDQTPVADSTFDAVERTQTFVPLTITPDYCKVNYECQEVTGP